MTYKNKVLTTVYGLIILLIIISLIIIFKDKIQYEETAADKNNIGFLIHDTKESLFHKLSEDDQTKILAEVIKIAQDPEIKDRDAFLEKVKENEELLKYKDIDKIITEISISINGEWIKKASE